ncbi:MAG TPA: hypothetical protein PLJ42_00550 [Chitinophagales bacterium]|jgi:hypothetical protein|nr:hypothetical protein [Chitinophagales bacterium]HQW77889.1 hypothetical protein [Chitinophagales bacterium]HRB19304.1 hypothetical protein [Chitinophagales bacterium]HRB66437.1 hypothetical protein [Chitinophagales bacterium]HRB68606.1 hypothetical protein [Chitinophagales bacterium]
MKKYIFIIAAIGLFATACKKDKIDINIDGYWVGTMYNSGGGTFANFAMMFKDGKNTILYSSSSDTVTEPKFFSTYAIGDSVVFTTDTPVGQITYSGKTNEGVTQMNGKYYPLSSSINSGTFTLTKQ